MLRSQGPDLEPQPVGCQSKTGLPSLVILAFRFSSSRAWPGIPLPSSLTKSPVPSTRRSGTHWRGSSCLPGTT